MSSTLRPLLRLAWLLPVLAVEVLWDAWRCGKPVGKGW